MKPTPLSSSFLTLAHFIGRLSLAVAQMLVATLLVWLALRLYPGDRWLFVRLGNYFAPWLLLALFPTLAVALLSRRHRLTGLTLVLLLVLGQPYVSRLLPRLAKVKAHDNAAELRVMTFNVHFANRNAADIAELIRTEQPDIIAFQELTAALQDLLAPKLASDYPHILTDNSWGLPMVLVSRYPLTVQPKLPETPRSQLAIVETPSGALAIWNVHPCPALNDGGWESQRQTLLAVAAQIDRQNGPLIVLGDFNTTDQAENYRLIAGRLTDAQQAVGEGWGFTFPDPAALGQMPWPGPWFALAAPAVGIDHIFVSSHFIPQEIHIVSNGYGSDHRPVVATLNFAQ